MHELHRMNMECIELNNLEYGQIATTDYLGQTKSQNQMYLLAGGVSTCKLANSVTCSLNEFLNANVCKSMNISDPKSAATSW